MRKRRRPRPQPDRALSLAPITLDCPECQHRLLARYDNFRTITTLDGVLRLTLAIRRCPNPDCPRFRQPYRPEAEPHFALPYHEFGLDVMALVGRLRHAEHRSIPEIHQDLIGRGLVVAQRTVTNLLDRYDELRALATADPKRLGPLLPSSVASSWRSTDCSPTSVMRSSGFCVTAFPARSSWPRASCHPPPRTWPA